MKDENIKEILDKLKSNNYPFGIATIDIDKLLDYITNLQEKVEEDMKIKDNTISINYNKDTKEYTLDRKNYYKINKRLNERLDYKSRNEKAIKLVNEMLENAYIDGKYIMYDYSTNEILEIKKTLTGGDKE